MTDKELDEQALRIWNDIISEQPPIEPVDRPLEFARRLRAEWMAQQEPCAWGVQMADKWWVGLYAWKENAEQVATKNKGDVVVPLYAAPVAKPAARLASLIADGNTIHDLKPPFGKEPAAQDCVSVPREPTTKMLEAAFRARVPGGSAVQDWMLPFADERGRSNLLDALGCAYAAMLAASEPKT